MSIGALEIMKLFAGPFLAKANTHRWASLCPGRTRGPGRPKRGPNLRHKWVTREQFVRLGSPTGRPFTNG
jgi:hypothetical protein